MILVTGGAGFIGSNLIAGLNNRDRDDIVICDTLGIGDKWKNIAKRRFADLIEPRVLNLWLDTHKDVEVVFHLGAISDTSQNDGDAALEANVELPRSLMERCEREGIPFIYASSAGTYGDGSLGFSDSISLLPQLRPLSLYAWSKHMFDQIAFREEPKHQRVGLKFFNVYGPNEYHKGTQQSMVAAVFDRIITGQPIRLFRSHKPIRRDFIHVDDVVDVLLWFLDHPDKSGLYNVGTGIAHSFEDVVAAVGKVTQTEPEIQYIDMPDQIRDRYQFNTQADISSLHTAGYDGAFLPLEAGVADYVSKYMMKPDRYR